MLIVNANAKILKYDGYTYHWQMGSIISYLGSHSDTSVSTVSTPTLLYPVVDPIHIMFSAQGWNLHTFLD